MVSAVPPGQLDPDALLRAAFDAAPIGKAIVAPDGRFLRVNPALCRMTGLDEDALLAGSFQEITHPDDLDADTDLLAQTIAGDRDGYELEKRYVRPDGTVWWAHLTVRLVRDDAGAPQVFVSQILDLTERRRQEDALASAERLHRQLLDNIPDAVVALYDRDLRVVSMRGGLLDTGDLDAGRYVGRSILETAMPGTLEILLPLLRDALAGTGSQVRLRAEVNGRDYDVSVLPQHDATGAVVGVMTVSRDITDQLAREEELAAVNRALEAVLTHTPAAVFLKDREQRFLIANEKTAAIVGRPGEDLVGMSLWDMYPREIVETLDANDAAVMTGGVPVQFEERAPDQADGGREHTWLAVKFPVRDVDGQVVGVGGISLDITARRDAENAQRAAEERFEVAFEHAAVPMALVALDGKDRGRVRHANHAYAEMLGRSTEEMIGRPLATWIHPDDVRTACEEPLRALAAGEVQRAQRERRYLHRDGHVVWTLATDARYVDADGAPLAVEQVQDISDRKHFEDRLRHLADHDALTGLFNRRRFQDELEAKIAHVRRYGGVFSLLAVDLDGFKYVNDSLGHAAGDDLVSRLSATLRDTLRETDVIARTGGDEFAVLLPEADATAAAVVAEKLVTELRRAGTLVDRHRHAQVTASVGATTFADEQDLTAEDLLVEADIAMYDAKAAGKNRHAAFERDQRRREQITERQQWLQRLRHAVDHERFELVAQPIVPVCSSDVPRHELLLRMVSEDGDLIPPGTFLYNAERFDLIEQIDHWVLGRAVHLLHEQHQAGNDLSLSVNVSARTIDAGRVVEHLAALMEAKPIRPQRLVVEVTETAAITNIARAQDLSRGLRSLGCCFALDDFGAGFATFYYLKHLAFDFVKIDGEFIRNLPDSPTDQLVVRAVVDIARGMGSDTIAEFVQDDRTMRLLEELGVGYAQGFHIGKPGPLTAALPTLH